MPNANRNKGHTFERELMALLKEIYPECTTSRNESRFADSLAIDFTNIPYNIQAKAGYPRGLNYRAILKEMHGRTQPYSKYKDKTNIIVHKMGVGRGNKRVKYDTIAVLSINDLINILKDAFNNNK